jgi:hypothetical protein
MTTQETEESTDKELAPTRRATPSAPDRDDGGLVPGGLAGYVYDGAAYCVECAEDVEVTDADGKSYSVAAFPADKTDGRGFGVGVISGMDEWDAPGPSCDVCLRRLDVSIIKYE